jgi:5-methylcytosine-specific restriction endonuclease McrA
VSKQSRRASIIDAKERGLKRFSTGDPCVHGHIAERFVSNGRCVECSYATARKRRAEKPEECLAYERRYYARNAERVKAYTRAWNKANRKSRLETERRYAEKHPGYALEKGRKQYAKDPEQSRIRQRERRQRDVEAHNARHREYLARHPEKTPEYYRRYRARKANASGSHTAADIAALERMQRHCCAYCRADLRKVGRSIDHIIPLSRGGSDAPANLQLLCRSCNSSKHARHPIEFARSRGMLL